VNKIENICTNTEICTHFFSFPHLRIIINSHALGRNNEKVMSEYNGIGSVRVSLYSPNRHGYSDQFPLSEKYKLRHLLTGHLRKHTHTHTHTHTYIHTCISS
jgi:hypothetical protein